MYHIPFTEGSRLQGGVSVLEVISFSISSMSICVFLECKGFLTLLFCTFASVWLVGNGSVMAESWNKFGVLRFCHWYHLEFVEFFC